MKLEDWYTEEFTGYTVVLTYNIALFVAKPCFRQNNTIYRIRPNKWKKTFILFNCWTIYINGLLTYVRHDPITVQQS